MLGAKRNDNGVVCRSCLKLKVERAAKTFSQRQSPGTIDPAAEWRMKHQLHAAGFVEEAFHHQSLLRRNCAQGTITSRKIAAKLLGNLRRQLHFFDGPVCGILCISKSPFNLQPKIRYGIRQFRGSRRRFSEPKWKSRWLAFGVLDAHHAGIDSQNSPRCVAELKDVPG